MDGGEAAGGGVMRCSGWRDGSSVCWGDLRERRGVIGWFLGWC